MKSSIVILEKSGAVSLREIPHLERVENYRRVIVTLSGAQYLTRENLTGLGDAFSRTAREVRTKARAGSVKHRGWRQNYLEFDRDIPASAFVHRPGRHVDSHAMSPICAESAGWASGISCGNN